MELSAAILGIAVALTLGAMSPGPSFIMVARTSVAVSRRDGLADKAGEEEDGEHIGQCLHELHGDLADHRPGLTLPEVLEMGSR